MNLTKFSRSYSHFGITIFEQEEGKRGIPLYQTWHIVNSITLYHITSYSILSYHMVSHPIKLSYQNCMIASPSPHIVVMYLQLYNNTCSFCIFIGRELCVIKVHTHG